MRLVLQLQLHDRPSYQFLVLGRNDDIVSLDRYHLSHEVLQVAGCDHDDFALGERDLFARLDKWYVHLGRRKVGLLVGLKDLQLLESRRNVLCVLRDESELVGSRIESHRARPRPTAVSEELTVAPLVWAWLHTT